MTPKATNDHENNNNDNGGGGVQTAETKQDFEDIYVQDDPVPYQREIMIKLSYISDNYNKAEFDRLVLPWIQSKQKQQQEQSNNNNKNNKIQLVDLCGCFGNTTLATVYGMDYEAICANWATHESCQTVVADRRRFACHTTGIDISAAAMAYGKRVGLYDDTIVVDLNAMTTAADVQTQVYATMARADVVICTAGLVYLNPSTIEQLLSAFASSNNNDDANNNKSDDGYMLVNFLNPFALESADATKRLLLQYLDFVGSTATRHRKMSALERQHYPGEEWVLLEIWTLRRRRSSQPTK